MHYTEAHALSIVAATNSISSAEHIIITSIDKTLKSLNADTKSTVNFFNKSSHPIVTVWLDYNGKPVKYSRIEPDGKYTQSTYVTHPWIAVEVDSGHCTLMLLNGWSVFFPQVSDTNVDITDPPQEPVLQDCLGLDYQSII